MELYRHAQADRPAGEAGDRSVRTVAGAIDVRMSNGRRAGCTGLDGAGFVSVNGLAKAWWAIRTRTRRDRLQNRPGFAREPL